MRRRIKRFLFQIPLVHRLFLGLFVTIVPLMILVSFFGGEVIYKSLIKIREEQLISIAQLLNDDMPVSYEQILLEKGQGAYTNEEKLAVLNNELQPMVDKFSDSHPKIGMGYYDLSMQHVVAIGPNFSSELLVRVPLEHPYLKYAVTEEVEVIKHPTSIGWEGDPIMGVTVPLFVEDNLVGHTWANTKIDDILLQTKEARRDLMLIILGLLTIGLVSTYYMFYLGRRALRQFAGLILSSEESIRADNGSFPELSKLVEEVKEKQKYQVLAETDGLTKLANRHYYENQLDDVFQETVRSSSDLSILMLDIDDFKLVNDTYGHKAGDEVLKAFSSVLLKNIREHEICGRYGGEEFIIALPYTEASKALKIAERIRTAVENMEIKVSTNKTIKFTVSIGVASYNQEQTWERIQDKADKNLYLAKQNGKNQVQGS